MLFSLLPALAHGVFVVAGLLVYVLVTRIGGQRRHPSAALAWVILIAALPYLGLPLFLLFGTRKVARPAPAQTGAGSPAPPQPGAPEWATRLLAGLGLAAPERSRAVSFQHDGPASYRALLALIDGAREQLAIGTFLLADDEVGNGVAAALLAAAAREVRVRLLVDAVGCLKTPRRWLDRLAAGGVELRRFMPLLHNPMRGRTNLRNHRKLAVADGQRLWSGGRNLADEYFIDHAGRPAWADLSFVADGALAARALAQFERDWRAASGRDDGARLPPTPRAAPLADGPLAQWVACGPDHADDNLHALLMTAAYQARERIVAVSPYFVPDDALLDAWCTACRRGVGVLLVLPRRSNHRLADWARERALRQLVAAGGRVLMLGAMVHAKAVVIDAELALCGTANLDSRSLFLNYEAMAAFYGAAEIAWLADWIGQLAASARPYRARRPPWWRDLVEGIVRAVGFQL